MKKLRNARCAARFGSEVLRPEEQCNGCQCQQGQRRARGFGPAELVGETREQEAVEHRANIAGSREAEHEPLHLRRIVAAGHRQGHGKTGTAHAEKHT
jgi:hypothetical protein